uniref:Protein aael aael010811 aedes aegypti n=1 Tax=Corethrella appendiculata TaxID=1370023 RepID=U5ENH1_9DIPT
MGRICIVHNCEENENTTLIHRFPKPIPSAEKWQKILKLEKYSIDDLLKKYAVCTKHFTKDSYRNPISRQLNKTAVPHLSPEYDDALDQTAFQSVIPPMMEVEEEYFDDFDTIEENYSLSEEDAIAPSTQEIILEYETSNPPVDIIQEEEEEERFIKIQPKPVKKELPKIMTPESTAQLIPIIFKNIPNSAKLVPVQVSKTQAKSFATIRQILPKPNLEEANEPPISTTITTTISPIRSTKEYETQTTQTEPIEIRTEDEIVENTIIMLEYGEYGTLSKLDLIKLAIENKTKIDELQKKLQTFEAAHETMMKSMEMFKSLMK